MSQTRSPLSHSGGAMAVGDAHLFPGFLTPVLTQLFSPKPATTFLTCSCRGDRRKCDRRKYAVKKVRFNQGSISQPPGHKSDTLTTEPHGRGRGTEVEMSKIQATFGHKGVEPFPKEALISFVSAVKAF